MVKITVMPRYVECNWIKLFTESYRGKYFGVNTRANPGASEMKLPHVTVYISYSDI